MKVADLRRTKVKTVSIVTSLDKGTIMNIYRVLPNGKKIKAGTTKVLANGKIHYSFKQAGTYQFIQN